MLVVKSLILSTLVDSARLSKHVYEAKLATEEVECPALTGMKGGALQGRCARSHVGACLGAKAKPDWTQCLPNMNLNCDPGFTKCKFSSTHFDENAQPSSEQPAAPFTSWCPTKTGMNGGALNGLCDKNRAVGACLGAKANTNTVQCLEGNRRTCDPGFEMCQFASDHFSLAEVEEETEALQPCASWVGNPGGKTGSCGKKAIGACHDPAGANGDKVITQCLETPWHMTDSYKCPSKAPVKCTLGGSVSPTTPPKVHEELNAFFPEVCKPRSDGKLLGKTVKEGGDGKGECGDHGNSRGHVGACYDPSGNGRTQCLSQKRVDGNYKCPADAPSKCQFGSKHFEVSSLMEVKTTSEMKVKALPSCEQWVGNHHETGMCVSEHKGACFDDKKTFTAGVVKITTQCLPSDWHMTDSYKCPSNAPQKCENKGTFESDPNVPADETLDPNFPDWCPDSTGAKSVWNGLCNKRQVGACFGPGTTQCLEPGMESHSCPTGFTKCQFSKSHDFSLAEVDEEVACPCGDCTCKRVSYGNFGWGYNCNGRFKSSSCSLAQTEMVAEVEAEQDADGEGGICCGDQVKGSRNYVEPGDRIVYKYEGSTYRLTVTQCLNSGRFQTNHPTKRGWNRNIGCTSSAWISFALMEAEQE